MVSFRFPSSARERREVWISASLPFSLSKLGAAREFAAAEVRSPSEKHLNKRPGGALSRAQGSARAALQKLKAAFAVWMATWSTGSELYSSKRYVFVTNEMIH